MLPSAQEQEPEAEPGTKRRWRPAVVEDVENTWHRLRHRFRARSLEEKNERVIYAEVAFQALSSAGAMSFISIFLVRLGAPTWLVGLYTSLPALVMTLAILPMSTYVKRRNNLVLTANWGRIIFRATVSLFALLPFLPAGIAPYALVGARSLLSIPASATNVSVQTLWGAVTTPRRRPAMLSTRMAIFRVVAAPLGFLAGQWLEYMPFPLNYQLLFATALFAGLGSIACMSRLKIPDETQKKMEAKREVSLREILPMVKSTPAFRNFALAALVFRLGIGLPQALFPIYRVRTLGSSDAWLGTLMMVQRLVGMVTFFGLNPLLSKAKFRRWLWIGPLGLALFPFTTALAQTPQMLLIPAFVVGTFGSVSNIFLKEALFQSSPEGDRPTFVAVNTFIAKLTRFIGPMLGTLLADVTSLGTALVIAACVRALGGLFFWRLGVAKGGDS